MQKLKFVVTYLDRPHESAVKALLTVQLDLEEAAEIAALIPTFAPTLGPAFLETLDRTQRMRLKARQSKAKAHGPIPWPLVRQTWITTLEVRDMTTACRTSV